MFLSRQNSQDQFIIYRSLLNELIENRNTVTKEIIDGIIIETSDLVNDRKSHYQVNNNNYSLVSFLAINYKSYFKNLKREDINDETYLKIKSYIEEDNYTTVVNGL